MQPTVAPLLAHVFLPTPSQPRLPPSSRFSKAGHSVSPLRAGTPFSDQISHQKSKLSLPDVFRITPANPVLKNVVLGFQFIRGHAEAFKFGVGRGRSEPLFGSEVGDVLSILIEQ